MNKSKPKVSVVINTCDRGAYLGDTLEGLKQQTYTNFEVILVNGPSTDNTEEVAKSYNVRYYTAPFNISVSRNVGIKNAAGEILAFIDDDAVPEPEWLEDLIKAYDDPEVAAAGGFVYNADGSGFQFQYGMIDKWGYPQTRADKPYEYNQPNEGYYNINIGTNASYRREPLIEVGGFDEEIEYYHDESDVCVRLINAGYKVAQLSNAYVHHKMAPSMRRDSKKRVTNWDAIVKNSVYFGIKHSKGQAGLAKRLLKFPVMEFRKYPAMFRLLMMGEYNPWQYLVRNLSLTRAFYRGYYRGFFQDRQLISGYNYRPKEFKQFVKKAEKYQKNIFVISQGFPPAAQDGITRYSHTLAEGLPAENQRVFVFTKSTNGIEQITFSGKYWVYTYVEATEEAGTGVGRTDKLLNHALAVNTKVELVNKKSKADVVLAPMFDIEGIGPILTGNAPVITTIMTPLKKVVETQWSWLKDPSLESVYDLERLCIERADGVMSISSAIKDTIADLYGVNWTKYKKDGGVLEVLPLGVDVEPLEDSQNDTLDSDQVRLLYVGRFERRKGIDLLLESLEELLPKNQNLQVDLVGNPDITDENGKKYFSEFKKKHKSEAWFKQITLHGFVDDETLNELYKTCDVFVAPSRYESFGLIFIEAMRYAKPVVGPDTGGVPETITDGKNGYLFKTGDSASLTKAITKLVDSPQQRAKFGTAARKTVEQKFDAKDMTKNFIRMVDKVQKTKS